MGEKDHRGASTTLLRSKEVSPLHKLITGNNEITVINLDQSGHSPESSGKRYTKPKGYKLLLKGSAPLCTICKNHERQREPLLYRDYINMIKH